MELKTFPEADIQYFMKSVFLSKIQALFPYPGGLKNLTHLTNANFQSVVLYSRYGT